MDGKPYITMGELADHLNCPVLGDRDKRIYGIALYQDSNEDLLTYIPYEKIPEIPNIGAGVMLTRPSIGLEIGRNYIVTKQDPYFLLESAIRLMIKEGLYGTKSCDAPLVSDTADVSERAIIGNGTVVCEQSRLMPGVVLGDNVIIGKGCYIGANTVIGSNTRIGDNVRIGACCCIGTENFEYCKHDTGWSKVPVIGGVCIEHSVSIGGNVVIERGTIGTTKIGAFTQIENLVQIGHEVKIGKCCHIVACAAIAGWAEIGDYVEIYGQAAVSNKVRVGDHAVLLARSGVDKAVKEDMVVYGSPAQEHRQELKFQAFLRRKFKENTKGER